MKKFFESLVIVLIFGAVGLPSLLMATANDWVWYMVVLAYLMPYLAFSVIFGIFYGLSMVFENHRYNKKVLLQKEKDEEELINIRKEIPTSDRWDRARYIVNQKELDNIKQSVAKDIIQKEQIIETYVKDIKNLITFANDDLGMNVVSKYYDDTAKSVPKSKQQKENK